MYINKLGFRQQKYTNLLEFGHEWKTRMLAIETGQVQNIAGAINAELT